MRLAFLWALMLLFCAIVRADGPTTQPRTDDGKIAAWWEDLAKPEPEASRALLNLSTMPDKVIPFLKEQLKPLDISEDAVRTLIGNLGSDDDSIWKPAFEKLKYFDPRLAIGLQKLMDETNEPISRNRLIDILCDVPADTYAGKNIALSKISHGDDYNFRDNGASWWAEAKVSQLGCKGMTRKTYWTRAERAIVLLEHFNTPDAVAILKDMATGNPDASPTKAAKDALEFLDH